MTEYVELHCHSHFSLLDGASSPEALVTRAAELGMNALALTDHDAVYGAVPFVEAARAQGIQPILGTELTLADGAHLTLLAENATGWANLCTLITLARHNANKGQAALPPDTLSAYTTGLIALSGCRKGHVPSALATGGEAAARAELDRLVALFGRDNVAVELTRAGDPLDDERNDTLAALAAEFRLPTVATNNVHYHHPARRRLATALAAVRARRSLDEMDGWLPAAGTAHLRSGEEMAARFAPWPGAVTTEAVSGGISVANATGSARSWSVPSCVRISYL